MTSLGFTKGSILVVESNKISPMRPQILKDLSQNKAYEIIRVSIMGNTKKVIEQLALNSIRIVYLDFYIHQIFYYKRVVMEILSCRSMFSNNPFILIGAWNNLPVNAMKESKVFKSATTEAIVSPFERVGFQVFDENVYNNGVLLLLNNKPRGELTIPKSIDEKTWSHIVDGVLEEKKSTLFTDEIHHLLFERFEVYDLFNDDIRENPTPQQMEDYLFNAKFPYNSLEATVFRFLSHDVSKSFTLSEIATGCIEPWIQRNPLEYHNKWISRANIHYQISSNLLVDFIERKKSHLYRYKFSLSKYLKYQTLYSFYYDLSFTTLYPTGYVRDLVKAELDLDLNQIPPIRHLEEIILKRQQQLVEQLFDAAKLINSVRRTVNFLGDQHIRFVAHVMNIQTEYKEIANDNRSYSLLMKILWTRRDQFQSYFQFSTFVRKEVLQWEIRWKTLLKRCGYLPT